MWIGVPLGFTRDGDPVANPGPAPTCVLGPPGSGKTVDVTCNYLLDEPGRQSIILLDAKNTGYAITHTYRRKVCGDANVKRINPDNLLSSGSDKWNPIKLDPRSPYFEDQAVNRATAMIPNTNEKQTHFTMAARSAWAAGIIDEVKTAALEMRAPDIARVRAIWTQDPKALRKTIERMMASGDPAITTRVAKFLGATEELDNIKSTIEAATSWMTASMIADMQTDAGVDFSACRDRPTTIYASLSTESLVDKGTYFRMLVATALGDLFKKPGLKTTIIIEEGFVLGRLEILESTYAIAREFDIDIVIVFQFLGQIKQHYPKTWNQFVSGALLAYRPGDLESAEFLAKRAGQEFVPVLSASDPSNPQDTGPRPSFGPQKRERIPVGQMFAMPRGTALVWLPGDDPPRIVNTRGYHAIRKLNARASPNPYYKGARNTGGTAKRIAVVAFGILAMLVGRAWLLGH